MLFYINDGGKKVAVFGPKIVDFLLAGLRPAPRWGSRPRPQLGLPPQTPFTSGELNWRRAETARFRFPIQVMYMTLEPLPPGVTARGPKTGAAVCVQEGRRSCRRKDRECLPR